ncbi:Iron-sulfur cluster assembly protein SufD [Alkalibacterium sp. AK22]|uniref:Fe-S cluster assembly protein SufD n=1 Tax=Alkalibacterium sp. AK22 TaxID=1229520 RepID=UPI0004456079|nr:Fe-S cluster assembly protein SufD [Alkalibacterium sp. AK22]EXJ24067.1 Iron-sulfur cluster assembly protein SufD [Alkalibacterium sp. AK22]
METKTKDYVSYKDALEAFSRAHEEPKWMLQLRLDALEKIEDLDLPVIERLRYNRWPLFQVPDLTGAPAAKSIDPFEFIEDKAEAARVIQTGNDTVIETLPDSLREKGVIFTDMHTALKEHPELVKEAYMSKAVKPDANKIAAFHAAFMNSGLFLYVPKNVEIEEPLEAVFIQNSLVEDAFIKHVLIYADTNSNFNYVEKFLTKGDEKNAANIVVEVITKAGAQVKFSAVDQLGLNSTVYFNRKGYTHRDSTIDWAIGVMNSGNVVCDFDVDLVGEGSSSDLKAVGISSGRQTQVIDSNVINYGNHTEGNIFQHGVIMDRATLTFNGIGHIIKGAKGADAQQESRVLMLSDKARGDANPILLIDENEVTAGHAASVGRVDPEEMYYLMSRGIEKTEAERLVIRGFLGKVISAIPLKSVRDELVHTIERKLTSR